MMVRIVGGIANGMLWANVYKEYEVPLLICICGALILVFVIDGLSAIRLHQKRAQ